MNRKRIIIFFAMSMDVCHGRNNLRRFFSNAPLASPRIIEGLLPLVYLLASIDYFCRGIHQLTQGPCPPKKA